MYITWLKFVVCAGIIFFAGKRVARYADVIAEKTGLSRLWIGIILVAIATSLPELFTGVGSVVFIDAPDLTIGNLFGANSYNLLNIGLLDILHKGGPLLSTMSSGQTLTAGLSLIPIMLAALAIILSGKDVATFCIGNIGIFSIAIFIVYCISAKFIYNFEKRKTSTGYLPAGSPHGEAVGRQGGIRDTKYDTITLKKAYTRYAMAAAVIVVSGIWLAYIGKELSTIFNLKQSFVGNLFVGFVTTLPEITVSIAALLIGAKEIAIANMLGSNLFNMVIIFVDDILYRKAPILSVVSPSHVRSACVVMAMTVIVILAIVTRSKKKFFNISWYTLANAIIFLLGVYLGFVL